MGRELLLVGSTYSTTMFQEATSIPASSTFSSYVEEDYYYGIGLKSKYNHTNITIGEVMDKNNFRPFKNKLQYSLSSWLLDKQVSCTSVDSYLQDNIINPQGRLFKDSNHFLRVLESIPYSIRDNY